MRRDERANKLDAPLHIARQCPFILLNPVHLTAQRRTNLLHDVTNNAAETPHAERAFARPELFFSLSPPSGVCRSLQKVVEPDGIEPTT